MLKANVTIVTDKGNIAPGEVFAPDEFNISAKEAESLVAREFAEEYVEPEPVLAQPVKTVKPADAAKSTDQKAADATKQ